MQYNQFWYIIHIYICNAISFGKKYTDTFNIDILSAIQLDLVQNTQIYTPYFGTKNTDTYYIYIYLYALFPNFHDMKYLMKKFYVYTNFVNPAWPGEDKFSL